MSWEIRFFCECGWSCSCPFNDPWFRNDDPCPDCGRAGRLLTRKTVRWINTATWKKPGTWFSGKWEYKLAAEGGGSHGE